MVSREPPAKNHDKVYRSVDGRSGRLLVELMRDSPLRDLIIESAAVRAPVRDVDLQQPQSEPR